MSLTTADLQYLGGLFDGEGCVMARLVNRHRRRPTYRVTVSLCMTQPDLVLWFKQQFGGSFVMRKKLSSHHKQAYQWVINDLGAYKFLVMLRPYVRLKARQFDLAMELHQRLQKTHATFRKGFHRGASIPESEMLIRHQLCERIRAAKYSDDQLGTLTIGANSADTCNGNAELNGVRHS